MLSDVRCIPSFPPRRWATGSGLRGGEGTEAGFERCLQHRATRQSGLGTAKRPGRNQRRSRRYSLVIVSQYSQNITSPGE